MSMEEKINRPFYKKWWVWLLAVIVLGGIINAFQEEEEPEKIEASAPVLEEKQKEEPIKKEEKNEAEPKEKEKEPKKEEPSKEDKEEIIAITAEALYQAYEDNEVAANLKYKDKQLEVTGTISDFGVDVFGTSYIMLATGGSFKDTQVFFKKGEEEKIAELSKGQSVTVIGKGGGLIITSVVLNKAQVK